MTYLFKESTMERIQGFMIDALIGVTIGFCLGLIVGIKAIENGWITDCGKIGAHVSNAGTPYLCTEQKSK